MYQQRKVIGVGGNIGSGKTTVTRFFKSFGAAYLSADKIGKQILTELTRKLKMKFGCRIMSGKIISRKKLGGIVFSNRNNLEYLNKLTHPILVKRILGQISEFKSGLFVIDAALLFNWPRVLKAIDYSVLVSAQDRLKMKRVLAKSIDKEMFWRIIKVQKKENDMAKQADFIVKNNGTLRKLKNECWRLYQEMKNGC